MIMIRGYNITALYNITHELYSISTHLIIECNMIEHAGNLMQGVPRHSNIAERIHNATNALYNNCKKDAACNKYKAH